MGDMRSWTLLSVSLLLAASVTACEHGTTQVLSVEDATALIAAAPEMSVATLLDDLKLDPSQRIEVEAKLEGLHDSMLELHALQPGDLNSMTPEEKADLHARLQGEMEGVHELHQEFMESLTEDQKGRFIEHVHNLLQSQQGEAADLHERHLLQGH